MDAEAEVAGKQESQRRRQKSWPNSKLRSVLRAESLGTLLTKPDNILYRRYSRTLLIECDMDYNIDNIEIGHYTI